MAIAATPPASAFSSSPRAAVPGAERGRKDTLRNVEATREFVVNIVDDALAEHMNLTSGDYPPEIDEVALAGLTSAPGVKVKTPRGAAPPISMGCKLARTTPPRNAPATLVLAEIPDFHVRDPIYDPATARLHLQRV